MTNWANTIEGYDTIVAECRELMLNKNHDYGEAWRYMRSTSITDLIMAKVMRVRKLEELHAEGKKAKVSESIESGLMDVFNYVIFGLIKLNEARDMEGGTEGSVTSLENSPNGNQSVDGSTPSPSSPDEYQDTRMWNSPSSNGLMVIQGNGSTEEATWLIKPDPDDLH